MLRRKAMVLNPLSRTYDSRLWILLIALLGAGWIVLLGIKSNVHLGDEPTHYMLASTLYETKERPLYYSFIHVSPVTRGKPVGSEVLWHSILASLWWVWGSKSAVIAQFYQAVWYILLILTTYLLGKTLYDERVGLYSGLLVATMPTVACYSMLMYTDIALSALCMLCFLLMLKNKYFWAGLTLGFMILIKRNAYLFVPSLLFCLVYSTGNTNYFRSFGGFLSFLKGGGSKLLLIFTIPAFLINIPDIYFRHTHLNTNLFASSAVELSYPVSSSSIVFVHPESFVYYPSNLLKYPGVVLYLCLGLYVLRRKYSAQDAVPIVTILTYCALFPLGVVAIYFLSPFVYQLTHSDNFSFWPTIGICVSSTITSVHTIIATNFSMRYLLPLLPMAAILVTKGLLTIEKKSVKYIIIALCILQMIVGTTYVYKARKLSAPLSEAYEYIRLHTPSDSSFLSPYADLSLYTNRIVMWNSDNTMPDLPYLFWNANPNEAMYILKKYEITHIFVPKSMLWDDSQVKNIGMYPKSFVNKIPSFGFLERIFYNEDVSIWAVRPPLVKKE